MNKLTFPGKICFGSRYTFNSVYCIYRVEPYKQLFGVFRESYICHGVCMKFTRWAKSSILLTLLNGQLYHNLIDEIDDASRIGPLNSNSQIGVEFVNYDQVLHGILSTGEFQSDSDYMLRIDSLDINYNKNRAVIVIKALCYEMSRQRKLNYIQKHKSIVYDVGNKTLLWKDRPYIPYNNGLVLNELDKRLNSLLEP